MALRPPNRPFRNYPPLSILFLCVPPRTFARGLSTGRRTSRKASPKVRKGGRKGIGLHYRNSDVPVRFDQPREGLHYYLAV